MDALIVYGSLIMQNYQYEPPVAAILPNAPHELLFQTLSKLLSKSPRREHRGLRTSGPVGLFSATSSGPNPFI